MTVSTQQCRKCDLLDFSKLCCGERAILISILIPETIAFTNSTELFANDTSKSWTDDTAVEWLLRATTNEEIDVFNVLVLLSKNINNAGVGEYAIQIFE